MKAVVLSLLLTVTTLAADEFSRWTWRNPTPLGTTLYSVVYAENQFVAVGAAGNIMSSPDGREWTIESSPTLKRLLGVTHGGGLFVAYGFEASLVSSPDGHHWTQPAHNLVHGIKGMAFGAEIWVALDEYGNIRSSPDLADWTERVSSVLSAFEDVIFAQDKFVAVGNRGVIMTSTNGIVWEPQDSGTAATFNDIAYGDGKFVTVGTSDESGTQGIILTSSNAEDWQIQFTEFPLYGVSFGPAGLTVVGGGFGGCGQSLTSAGGLYFESGPDDCGSGLGTTPYDVACNDEVCIAVGFDGLVAVSEDGLLWEEQQRGTTMTLFAIAASEDRLIAAGQINAVTSSTNGRDFAEQVVPGNWRDCATDGQAFVLVGEDGAIAESPDGLQWLHPASPVSVDLRSVVHGPAGWLAGGLDSFGTTIVRQADGSWELGSFLGKRIDRLHYSPRLNRYIAVGNAGMCALSSNRVDWSYSGPVTTKYLVGIAESPERLLVVAFDGALFTSTNGINWVASSIGTAEPGNWTGALYGNGMFLVLGRLQTNLFWSPDGVTWENRSVGTDLILDGIFHQGSFYLVGNGGMILQSTSASVPEFISISPDVGGLDFQLFGEIGRDYELQSSTNLTAWVHEQDYTQSMRSQPLTLPADPGQRFYRVKLKEP